MHVRAGFVHALSGRACGLVDPGLRASAHNSAGGSCQYMLYPAVCRSTCTIDDCLPAPSRSVGWAQETFVAYIWAGAEPVPQHRAVPAGLTVGAVAC